MCSSSDRFALPSQELSIGHPREHPAQSTTPTSLFLARLPDPAVHICDPPIHSLEASRLGRP